MSPSKISKRIFLDRLAWVDRMPQLGDITTIQEALLAWYDRHQELVDPAL